MQETALFFCTALCILKLAWMVLELNLWVAQAAAQLYTKVVCTVDFVGYQAELFKRNKKVLLEGQRSMTHSALSTTTLYDSHAKHFKSQVIHRSRSPNWYQSSHQFQSWQNNSLKTSMLLGLGMANTQYSNVPSSRLGKEKGKKRKNQQNCSLLRQVGQQGALPATSRKPQLPEHSYIPTHCIISLWLKIWALHGQWTH